jgi:hypothetical protein
MATRITAIYGDQIDDSVAGAGLVMNKSDDQTHTLDVNVDGSSIVVNGDVIEIGAITETELNVDDITIEFASGDILQVKDGGISESKLDVYNSPTDNYVLAWNSSEGKMEWIDVDVNGLQEDDIVVGEVPSGLINSSNTSYTIANTPVTDSVSVYLNGLRQREGSAYDYTISGTSITFAKAPRTGSDLLVDYFKTP